MAIPAGPEAHPDMHINAETFHTIFLSPAEMGQLRVELAEASDFDWKQYPALDRLTDAIAHGGTPDDANNYTNEV